MNRDEFIKFVEGNQKSLRRFLIALCGGDCDLADDIAQDTFVKAYLACDSFRGESKISTWIFKIAYNTYLTSKHQKRIEYTTIDDARTIHSKDRADKTFEYQLLYRALDQLSEMERTVVLLHYIQGYDLKELAEITSSTVDAVKQRLSRGRKHLRNLMTK